MLYSHHIIQSDNLNLRYNSMNEERKNEKASKVSKVSILSILDFQRFQDLIFRLR